MSLDVMPRVFPIYTETSFYLRGFRGLFVLMTVEMVADCGFLYEVNRSLWSRRWAFLQTNSKFGHFKMPTKSYSTKKWGGGYEDGRTGGKIVELF